ncbi:MAG: alpha-L-rhamnosidase [Acidobacteria bacterium]|nr:alpha-L-rhamnosidase [Acidobacteriota bacterium]
MQKRFLCFFVFFSFVALNLSGQTAPSVYSPTPLDLTAHIQHPRLESELHHPLPEQYIWAQGQEKTDGPYGRFGRAPQWIYFRRGFDLKSVPGTATLYAAGPADMRVYLNGRLLANAQRNLISGIIRVYVLILNVNGSLRPGRNVLSLAVAGGWRRLAVKIVPRPPEENGPAILMSGRGWKYSTQEQNGWEQPGFDDSSWQAAAVLGGIESNINFFQGNQDTGMYRWPGYDGISPFLARVPVRAEAVDVFRGLGAFHNTNVLAAKGNQLSAPPQRDFIVDLPPAGALKSEYPSVMLDFGREVAGRLEVVSDSDAPLRLALQYGESLGETLHRPYFGIDKLDVPPHATAYGPKSAFRYAKVTFLGGASPLRFKAILLDDIYYPVHYRGSFDSSDPLVNRIWDLGAYTDHLCMQDDIWDAPKRDRARWMGDLDVSGHAIDAVFADHFLMQQTMDYLIRDAGQPVDRDVNGIPGYSAFWVMGEADYYRHFDNLSYLRSIHQPLVQLLDYMASELDSRSVFTDRHRAGIFVDWSPGLAPQLLPSAKLPLSEFAPDAQRATQFEFYAAFREGAWLLRQLGDSSNADRFAAKATAIRSAALKYMLDSQSETFGERWQPNAMAIYSGLADKAQTEAIWRNVLSHRNKFRITPYYNYYVISAMASAGHYKAALDWIRKYWGGMVRRGATSTWEGYQEGLPMHGWHGNLRADNGRGYFVSLAHGWSSGPTIWLMQYILGIRPAAPGFTQVTIRPELAGLKWAKGAEPTPQGLIKVDYRAGSHGLSATVDLPPGTQATVSMPVTQGATVVRMNGRTESATSAEGGRRAIVHLDQPGHYTLQSE